MPKWTVTSPDGTTYRGVEAATQEEAVRRMQQGPQGALKPVPAPQTPQEAPVSQQQPQQQPSGPLQRLEQAIPQGLVGPTIGGIAGGFLGGPGGAILGAGLGGAGEENARQMIRREFNPLGVVGAGALGAGQQAGGEALGAFGRYAFSPLLKSRFAEETAGKLAELIKGKVPAWTPYGKGTKGLVEMMSLQGQRDLSKAFDTSLQDVISKGKGTPIAIRPEAAAMLKLTPTGQVAPVAPGGPEHVTVDAADAAQAIVGKWTKMPQVYRQVAEALDQANVGDPAARAAYKWGTGLRRYLDATKALEGERYWPERAQAGLLRLKPQTELGRRGMGEAAEIMRGPGEKPITTRKISPWEKRLMGAGAGALAGGVGGGSPGHFGGGGLLGAVAGEALLPSAVFHNVPLTGAAKGIERGTTVTLGDIGRLIGESFRSTSS